MKVFQTAVFLCWLFPLMGYSQTIRFSLQEFHSALESGQSLESALTPVLLEKFQAAWDRLDLRWGESSLDYPLQPEIGVLKAGCSRSVVAQDFTGQVSLADGAALAVNFRSLRDPVTLSLSAPLVFQLSGKVEQRFGLKAFNRCRPYARDNFTLTAEGRGLLHMKVTIQPGLSLVGNALQLRPAIQVEAALPQFERRVRVDHTAADSFIVDAIEGKIDQLLSPEAVTAIGHKLERRLQDRLEEAWGGSSLSIVLPELDAAARSELERLLSKELAFPVGEAYLKSHLPQIWYSVVTGDQAQLRDVLLNSAACEAASQYLLPIKTHPLFHREKGACVAVAVASREYPAGLFSDASCRTPVTARPYPLRTYCQDNFDKARIGNGALLQEGVTSWHLSPGTRLAIALDSTADLPQPWVTERVYRKVATPQGECELEMRIYKSSPDASGLKPVIALHGGNWQFRRLGTTAMEAVMPQLTARNAVVFLPFYRLAGHGEGIPACQQASAEEITSDVAAALAWVEAYGRDFGAAAGKIAVTGQSAGAHLATWLATHFPTRIDAAFLLYPPTDMADYLQQWRSGALGKDPKGLDAVEAFMKVDSPDAIDLSDPVVLDNTLPSMVALDPTRIPPMFIVHGGADQLVPVRQSLRLCNALGGNPDAGPASGFQPGVSSLPVQVFACDQRGSQLHVVTEGDHMLDFCFGDLWCPSGRAETRDAVRKTLRQGYDWLMRPKSVAADNGSRGSAVMAGSGGGGEFGTGLCLIMASGCWIRRYRRSARTA